jgi:hypothetical protein
MTPSNLQVRDRDISVLCSLFESRVMTSAHISELHFDGSPEAAKKRLQKLKAAGWIAQRRRRVNEPAVHFLTSKGFGLLRKRADLSSYPSLGPASFEKRVPVSELTLRHELEVMDVKSAFYSAVASGNHLNFAQFSTWPILYQFFASRSSYGGSEVLVKPDGFIRLNEQYEDGRLVEHCFFLEVDRSSETQDTLVQRAACYLDYYHSGEFALWNGATRQDVKKYPFRVLMVFKNEERRNNTAERLLQHNPPIRKQTFLTTLAEATSDPLGAIWIRPLDYGLATERTAFDPYRQTQNGTYRRQPMREILVAERTKKLNLLHSERGA